MPGSIPTLNYGHMPRSRKKLYLWTAAAVVAGILWFNLGPPVTRYLDHIAAVRRYLHAQDVACNLTVPATLVFYSDDPKYSSALVGDVRYSARHDIFATPGEVELNDAQFGLIPAFTALVRAAGAYPGFQLPLMGSPIFLHQRRSPAGHDRLVCISFWNNGHGSDHDGSTVYLISQVLMFATATTSPTSVYSAQMLMNRWSNHPPLTVFAGQVDPADPSHFTIPIDYRGQNRVIDGYLHDDDTIVLDPHLGYVRPPPSNNGMVDSFYLDGYAIQQVAITTPIFKLPSVPSVSGPPIEFSPDGSIIYTRDPHGISHLWTIATGQPAGSEDFPSYYQPASYYDVIGEWVTVGSLHRTVAGLPHNNDRSVAVTSPDSRFVATPLTGNDLYLWQLPDCDILYDIKTNARPTFFTFSPDSRRIATIDKNDELDIWNLPATEPNNH